MTPATVAEHASRRRPDEPGKVTTATRRLWAAMLAVGVLTVALAAPGVWVRATYGNQTSADEPHYLLTAISLAEDGDLDIADEVAAERYRPFHEQSLLAQAATSPDGRQLVPHDPLLPALLAGPMHLGGWRGAKLALATLAGALAGLTLWTAVRRFDVALAPATLTTAVLCASAPMVVYGTQIYPEVPAALALIGGVAAAAGPSRLRTNAGVAVAVIALPWLAVKYVPVAATLAAAHLVRRWRQGQRQTVLASLAVLVFAGAVYLTLHVAWYGGLTAYAAGEFFQEHGGQLSVVGTDPNYLARSRRLLGLLVDRDFGIAAWQPAWLLAPGAAAWLLRRRPQGWPLLAAPAAAGWLTATFVALTMHGWWFPGRQIVVVLPLLAVAISHWAATHRMVAISVWTLGAAGLVTTGWLLVDGLGERLTLIVDFARTASPPFRLLRVALPNYLDMTMRTWSLHTAWLAVVALLATIAWRHAANLASRALHPGHSASDVVPSETSGATQSVTGAAAPVTDPAGEPRRPLLGEQPHDPRSEP